MNRVLAVIAFVVVAAAPARAAPRTLALVTYGDAVELEAALREELAKTPEHVLQQKRATAAELDAAKEMGLVCGPDSVDCLVRVALVARVDKLVVATATRGAGGLALELAVIDAAVGKETGRAAARVPVDAQAAQAAVEDAVAGLLRPETMASIVLAAEPADATLVVDGALQDVGASGRPRVRVRPGTHKVEVRRAGYEPWARDVVTEAGSEVLVEVALQRLDEAAAGQPAPAAAGASPLLVGGGVVAGIGAVALLGGATSAIVLDAMLSTTDTGTGEERLTMHAAERGLAVLALVGGVAAAAGGAAIGLALAE